MAERLFDAEHEKREREVAAKMEEIERKMEQAISNPPPAPERPIAPLVPKAASVQEHVRLRCESILHMAFQTWLTQVRGAAPFVGPQDMLKLNEIKRLLFSINGENNDFSKE